MLVAVLKGSVLFLADLVRGLIDRPARSTSSPSRRYHAGTGRVRIVKDLETDIAGRDVVLVEDIVDTGLTADLPRSASSASASPRSLAVCTLLDKACAAHRADPVRYVGFEIADEFVLGLRAGLRRALPQPRPRRRRRPRRPARPTPTRTSLRCIGG